LAGLAGFTAWHFTYSPALAEARAAYEGVAAGKGGTATATWLGPIDDLVASVQGPERDGKRRGRAAASAPQPDYPLALRRALDHLTRHPDDPEASRLAALCLSRLDYAAEAEPYYQVARRKGRLSVADLHVRALGLTRGNLREQALAAHDEILALQSDNPEALQRLAAIHYSLSHYKETLAVAERLSRSPITSRAVAGYAMIGIVHHDEHRPGPAVAANEKVLELDPQLKTLTLPADLFFADFAQDLIDIGRAAEARPHLLRVLGTGPRDDPPLIDILGSAYYAEGQDDDAERCWKRAADLDPRFHRPWLNLGKLALRRGRLAEALPYLETAHSLGPQVYEPAYQLSLAYRRLGRAAEAERYRKLAESLRQHNRLNQRGAGLIPPE
jgi:tetratricopeptide (TPR) repeat protein